MNDPRFFVFLRDCVFFSTIKRIITQIAYIYEIAIYAQIHFWVIGAFNRYPTHLTHLRPFSVASLDIVWAEMTTPRLTGFLTDAGFIHHDAMGAFNDYLIR